MKYRIPQDVCGVTLDGAAMPIVDGMVETAAAAAASLAAHGLAPVEEPAVGLVENKPETTTARRGRP